MSHGLLLWSTPPIGQFFPPPGQRKPLIGRALGALLTRSPPRRRLWPLHVAAVSCLDISSSSTPQTSLPTTPSPTITCNTDTQHTTKLEHFSKPGKFIVFFSVQLEIFLLKWKKRDFAVICWSDQSWPRSSGVCLNQIWLIFDFTSVPSPALPPSPWRTPT